jgi:hypothetical protein
MFEGEDVPAGGIVTGIGVIHGYGIFYLESIVSLLQMMRL